MSSTTYARVEAAPFVRWWHETYGGPADLFAGLAFFQRGKGSVWVAAEDVDPGDLAPVDGVGLPFVRVGRRVWKPASPAVLRFGAAATRNVFEATAAEAAAILSGGTVTTPSGDPRVPDPARGHAIVRLGGIPVGCALWRSGALESCVPKGNRIAEADLPPDLR